MVNNILEKISSDIGISNFETFQKLLHTDYGIKWQSYHGISLEGNDCRKLLRITNEITWPEQTPTSSIDVLSYRQRGVKIKILQDIICFRIKHMNIHI